MTSITFLDLPEDIILLVFPYLRPKEFLALCSINKQFHETFPLEPSYWREETRKTFRHPIHPLLQADGPRWQWLYKKLLTKTKVYTWGQGGDSRPPALRPPRRRGGMHPHNVSFGNPWPNETYAEDDMGIVVDVQCGGWSTTLLNSLGLLFTVGKLDGTSVMIQSSHKLSQLKFSAAYPSTSQTRYEPSTAIKQYSSGRRHVLALSDSGKIWYWTDRKPALQVKFLHLDLVEGDKRFENPNPRGVVNKVAAGWDDSSAYVSGAGIVYWNVFKNELRLSETDDSDTVLFDAVAIPGTDFKRPKSQTRDTKQQEHEIGEVLNHIVLNEYIVFITDLNKVFAACTKSLLEFDEFDRTLGVHPNAVFELTTFSSPNRELRDIQGAFERFAVFAADGSVLMGNNSLLRVFWSHQRTAVNLLPRPSILQALQSSNVISLAFGDHHMHALHANGRISSYGTEPQGCGALGLGDKDVRVFRGVHTLPNSDGTLVPHAEHFPHYVWFDEDMRNWLFRLGRAALDLKAQARVHAITYDKTLQGEFSEWVEQQGLAWDDYPDIKEQDPDGLGAYFALSVAAAGWHSCALVLVDEDLAKKVRRKHVHSGQNLPLDGRYLLIRSAGENRLTGGFEAEDIQAFRYDFYDQPFPRLRLPSGFEMPGGYEFNHWRYGMPPVRGEVVKTKNLLMDEAGLGVYDIPYGPAEFQ